MTYFRDGGHEMLLTGLLHAAQRSHLQQRDFYAEAQNTY
jgi:hypothetical protein